MKLTVAVFPDMWANSCRLTVIVNLFLSLKYLVTLPWLLLDARYWSVSCAAVENAKYHLSTWLLAVQLCSVHERNQFTLMSAHDITWVNSFGWLTWHLHAEGRLREATEAFHLLPTPHPPVWPNNLAESFLKLPLHFIITQVGISFKIETFFSGSN